MTTFVVPNVIIMIGLILVTALNAFPVSWFINHLCATQCLKDLQIGNDTIHSELLLTVGVIRWNKIAWMLATQRQEKLFVNN